MHEQPEWQTQKLCTDIQNYELSVEKQKTSWNCSQKRESWRWVVNYHGTVVASGAVNDADTAKEMAIKNVPVQETKQ